MNAALTQVTIFSLPLSSVYIYSSQESSMSIFIYFRILKLFLYWTRPSIKSICTSKVLQPLVHFGAEWQSNRATSSASAYAVIDCFSIHRWLYYSHPGARSYHHASEVTRKYCLGRIHIHLFMMTKEKSKWMTDDKCMRLFVEPWLARGFGRNR